MKKAELILANFDAKIPKIEIKSKNTDSKEVFSSKMYDEETGEKISVKIHFSNVAAIDFRIFDRRKEVFLLEGDYNYDEDDEHERGER